MGWPGPMTARQFQAYQIWKDENLDIPNKDQAYLMQIAQEVRRVLAKSPESILLEHFRLERKKKQAQPAESKEDRKAARAARGPMTHKRVDKDGNPVP